MNRSSFLLTVRAYNNVVLSVGLGLLLAGIFAILIVGGTHWWNLTLLLVGIAILALFLVANLTQVKEVGKRRSTFVAANLTLVSLAVLGIVGGLNYVVSRHPVRFDMTSNKFYSLSEQTVDVLQKLTKDVDVTLFMSSRRPMAEVQRAQQLLEEYGKKSNKFHFKAIDMDRDTTEAKRMGIHEYNTVVFDNGDNRKDVLQRDYVTYAMQGRNPTPKFQGESAFTAALVKMNDTTHLTFYFTQGHGERDLSDPNPDGMNLFKDMLEKQNYSDKTLNIAQQGKIPEDAAAVAVVGPSKPFLPEETEALRKYVEKGGKAILFLDPNTRTGLEPLLKDYGVKLGNDVVVDPERHNFMDVREVIPEYVGHPIVEKLQTNNVFCLMPVSRSVQKVDPALKGVSQTVFLQSSATGWGVTNMKEKKLAYHAGIDTKAPVPMAMACEWTPADAATLKSRVVVFGTSSFITNHYLEAAGDLDLALNSFNWAVDQESKIDIHPKEEEVRTLTLSAVAVNFIKYLCVVIMPLFVLAFGGYIWYRRRSL